MDLIRFAILNPVKVTVGVLLLLLAGVLALTAIPVQLTPNVDEPIVTITTNWVGSSPQEVEREIIEEQEEKLDSVTGLKKMSATAYEGQAIVTMEFYVGADMLRALREVSDKLREVPEYPDDADEPVVTLSSGSGETPIAWLIVTTETAGFDVEGIKDLAEDRIKPYLERIDGLSEVRVYGGRDRQVHVQVNPQRMAERGITFRQLRDALRLANVNISAGSVADGRLDVRIRTVGEYDEMDKVRQTIVAHTSGGVIRVRDVADVVLTLEKQRGFVRSKARPAIALPCYREPGANVMRVMAELKDRLKTVQSTVLPSIGEQVKRDLNLPATPVFNIEQVYDETIYIEDAISLVEQNLMFGGVLAALVLILFLRNIRATVIVAFAIPISVIGTFVAMTASGRSINVISLAGLAFAVGMVVDAAIVVLENIDRHLSLGKKPFRAAYDGAREVWGAILASTLTTIAVFLPVLFMEEEAGQLFRDIALAVCAAVALSLIVSITVIPTAGSHFLRERKHQPWALTRLIKNLFGLAPLLDKLVLGFSKLLGWIVKPNPLLFTIRAGIVAAITFLCVWGTGRLMPKTTYLPAGNKNLVFGFVLTPPAYTVEQNRFIGNRVEDDVVPLFERKMVDGDLSDPAVRAKNVKANMARIAQRPPVPNPTNPGTMLTDIPPMENFFFVSLSRGMFTGAISSDKQNVKPLAGVLGTAISKIPGAYGGASQASIFARGLGGNNRIDIEITGYDLEDIRKSAGALLGRLMQMPRYGPTAVRPNPGNFNLPGPELRIEIDRVRAAELNIDQTSLALATQALVDGSIVGDFRLGGDSLDIVLVRAPDYDVQLDTLNTVPLVAQVNGTTMIVPLSSVARLAPGEAPQTITRINKQRSVTLEVSAPDELPLEQAEEQLTALVEELKQQGAIAPTVEVAQAGTADKLTQVRRSLLGEWQGWTMESLLSVGFSRMFLALVVTYLLMAALFESFLYPFVIMFSVPLAAVGGFMGLAIVHEQNPSQLFDVVTMLGFVILIGVVVNNAILIVHQALNFMRGLGEGEGDTTGKLSPQDAIRQSVRTRVRPVFMTTMTSVLGMLPLVVMGGAGSELYRGLGSVVVGGLLVSTVFTLVVVPLVFSIVLDMKRAWLVLTGQGGRDLEVISVDPSLKA